MDSNRKTMKSASAERPPDEAHGPGEETIRPQQCSEAWGSQEKKVHTGTLHLRTPHFCKLLHRSAFKNSAEFRQTFSHVYRFIFKMSLIFRKFCPNFTNFDKKFPEFQNFFWKGLKSPRFSSFLRFRTENC